MRWKRPWPSFAGLGTAMTICSGSLGSMALLVWRSFWRSFFRAPFDCWSPTMSVRSERRDPAPKGSILGSTTSSPIWVWPTPLLRRQATRSTRCGESRRSRTRWKCSESWSKGNGSRTTMVGAPGVRCRTPPTGWYSAVRASNSPAMASSNQPESAPM